MNFIWNFETLSALCMHKSSEVREWAIDRLSLLYPDRAGNIAARLINDGDALVARKFVDHFLQHPSKIHRDTLLNSYKKSSGIIAGKIANILARLGDTRLIIAFKGKYNADRKTDLTGYSLSVLNIAMLHSGESREIAEGSLKVILKNKDYGDTIVSTLFDANLIAGTDMKRLLNFCYSRPDRPDLIVNLLTEIGRDCGSSYSAEDIEEEGKKGFISHDLPHRVRESLEYIESHGFAETTSEIERLFKRERYEEAVEEIFNATDALIKAEKEEHGGDAFYAWENGRGRPRQNISAINAFRDTVKTAPDGFRRFIARNTLAVFARLIEYRGLIGLDVDTMDRESILYTFLQERRAVEEDDRLIEALVNGGDREGIADICVRHITEHPDSWANIRIVNLLGRLRDAMAIAQIFSIKTDDGRLWEEIVSASVQSGPEILPVVRPVFEGLDEERIGYALEVLENIPSAESADIIINHWDTLWVMDKKGVLEAVRGIGDRRFIEPLKRELKEGEILEARVFYHLCMINKVIDPRLKKIERGIANYVKRLNQRLGAFKSSDMDRLLQGPLELELKCRGCRRSYHYDVKKIMLGSEIDDKYIMDRIRCKNCGVVDHYELTPNAQMSMISHMALLTMRMETGKGNINGGVFVRGGFTPIDGKKISLEEGVRYYEKKVGDNPGNPEYLIGYANTLRTAKRTEDAIPHYKNAIIHDPLAIEAYVSLGQIAENKGDHKSAYEYYSKAAGIIHTGNFYKLKQDIDRFKEALLDNLLSLQEKAGVKSAPRQDTGSVVKHSKVGRNAPCPCGSGRKYKKCCLHKETGQMPAPGTTTSSVEVRLINRIGHYLEDLPEEEEVFLTEERDNVIMAKAH